MADRVQEELSQSRRGRHLDQSHRFPLFIRRAGAGRLQPRKPRPLGEPRACLGRRERCDADLGPEYDYHPQPFIRTCVQLAPRTHGFVWGRLMRRRPSAAVEFTGRRIRNTVT